VPEEGDFSPRERGGEKWYFLRVFRTLQKKRGGNVKGGKQKGEANKGA